MTKAATLIGCSGHYNPVCLIAGVVEGRSVAEEAGCPVGSVEDVG